ncbi:MAG: helix-hairpin-helix domain-containing protein [Phormidesmis sp.]
MIQTTLFPDTFKQYFPFSNDDVANMFEQIADLLEAQADDFYRIRAYRRGAAAVRSLNQGVIELYQAEGTAGLEKLPHIGRRLALSIEELAKTGGLALLERLLIDVSPEDRFTTVPGIGPVLARRIYRQLGIDTLEALEQAAHDGTLATLPGFGRGRIQLVRDALGAMLDRASRQRVKVKRWQQEVDARPVAIAAPLAPPILQQPSVELLLEVDAQYRYLAKAGQLRMVTPRRFNPEGKRWLPVMQLKREGWSFNVLYSNTARSHELNKTHDWVVVYYEKDGHQGQCTIVTETRGANRGDRVIRGREMAASA